VRKGEKAALVVFRKTFERSREETEDQEPTASRSILARGYHVFNAAEVNG
jgi:antirestriction protein ArdC